MAKLMVISNFFCDLGSSYPLGQQAFFLDCLKRSGMRPGQFSEARPPAANWLALVVAARYGLTNHGLDSGWNAIRGLANHLLADFGSNRDLGHIAENPDEWATRELEEKRSKR